MRRRRNSDEFVRELERRVLTGDFSVVRELARAYDRAELGSDGGLSAARDVVRDAYWRDVREIAEALPDRSAVLGLRDDLRDASHIRSHQTPQIRTRQGGWVNVQPRLAGAITATRRLGSSASIREVLAFCGAVIPRNLVDLSAKAERALLWDVLAEATRRLEEFPYALGSRLKVKRELASSVGEGERPDQVVEPGTLGVLVSFSRYQGTYECNVRLDDYWADWGDEISFEYVDVSEFDLDYEVLS